MAYHHLTYNERIQLGALLQAGNEIPHIAAKLNRPKSTLYRELARNSFQGKYFAETAQLKATYRKSEASSDRDFDEELWSDVEQGLKHGMSPEQISGRLKAENSESISASTIYRRIKADRENDGDLWIYLRRSGKTYRKKYGAGTGTESGIKNRVSIEKRPEFIENRKRHGDLEGDTLIGAKHKGAILTMNDRVTQKVVIEKLASREASGVSEAMIRASKRFDGPIHTCTLDNGKEFAAHESFSKATGAEVYFCHTMSPQERGSNENLNGLIRQYLRKGTDLSQVTVERIRMIEYSLNTRPRKTLDFQTPLEIESGGKIQFHFFS